MAGHDDLESFKGVCCQAVGGTSSGGACMDVLPHPDLKNGCAPPPCVSILGTSTKLCQLTGILRLRFYLDRVFAKEPLKVEMIAVFSLDT